MPACSVVIVNWNGLRHLEACLCSLRAQTFRDFEVIVVDNGSTDGSIDYVRSKFPDVRLICQGRNSGFAAASNAGIAASQGEFVVFLNNDTETDPSWLEELLSTIQSRPDIGFCASKILFFDDRNRIDSAGDELSSNGVVQKRGHRKPDVGFDQLQPIFSACGGAALFRRSVLDDIGGFDEDFFLIFEDADLSFRAQLAGYSGLFVPTARIYHKGNASIGTLSDTYVYYGHRNLEFVYLQNMPTALLLRSLPAHLLYDVLAMFYFASRRRLKPFLRAKAAVIRALPTILKKRARIQRGRKISNVRARSLITSGWLGERWRLRMKHRLSTGAPP